jgi:taurine dioxygenase
MIVSPIAATFGARITDVDVMSLADAELAELLDTFHRFKLVVIPDQHLDDETHMLFAKRIGEVAGGSFGPKFSPQLQEIGQDEYGAIAKNFDKEGTGAKIDLGDGRQMSGVFHSDGMFWPEPPAIGVFRLIEGPELGGDTVFADMGAVFESLSAPMREFLLPLRAVHDVKMSAQHLFSPERLVDVQAEFPLIAHPLVRTHPVTGVRSIYVCALTTSHIEGLRADESKALLEFLYAQPSRAEFQCRVHWTPGSIGLWDNRSLVHAATHDYGSQRRTIRRISIVGTVPV